MSKVSDYNEENDEVLPLSNQGRPSSHMDNMRNFRASMKANPGAINQQRASVANTLARASQKFSLDGGTDAAALVVENERLKTTIHVLSKKLEGLEYNDEEQMKLRKDKNIHLDQIDDLKTQVSKLEGELEVRVSEYESKLANQVSEAEGRLAVQVSEAKGRLEATVSDYDARMKA